MKFHTPESPYYTRTVAEVWFDSVRGRARQPVSPSVQGDTGAEHEEDVEVSSVKIRDHRDILLAPVVSEKSYGLLDENKYTFLVAPDANKTEIKIAVETVFKVNVTGVNTLNRPGKKRRTRYGFGKRPDTKRAIVTVADGQRIDIFSAPGS